jgi:hypothetical protein
LERSSRNTLLRGATFLILFAATMCAWTPAFGEINEADRALAAQVFQQLLASAPVSSRTAWPPTLEIIDKD